MFEIRIRVIPNAKKNRILEEGGKLKAYVAAPAVEGKANKALIKLLANHFNVKKGNVRIIKGARSREKVVKIDTSTGHLEP